MPKAKKQSGLFKGWWSNPMERPGHVAMDVLCMGGFHFCRMVRSSAEHSNLRAFAQEEVLAEVEYAKR